MSERSCSIDDCPRPHYARDLCAMHYKRVLRTGDPDARRALTTCSALGCERDAKARGLCHGHYQRWWRTGDIDPDTPLGRRLRPLSCSVEGCGRGTHAHGLCRSHLRRLRERGDVMADVPIRTVTGEGALSHGYWRVPVPEADRHLTGGATSIHEHRLVMARAIGRALLPDEVVHHRNGDRLDNRLDNLELWSTYQPKGQRVEDKVAYALEILRRYRPSALDAQTRGSHLDVDAGVPQRPGSRPRAGSWVVPPSRFELPLPP